MSKVSDRRGRALERLKSQLAAGTKTAKKTNKKVPLTDGDKNRIEKEIGILSK